MLIDSKNKTKKQITICELHATTYGSHLTLFSGPPLGIVRMVPKKLLTGAPQFGHGPWHNEIAQLTIDGF